MIFLLLLFFATAQAATFGVYSDPKCQELVIPVQAFTDVCTWNTYTTSYALYLQNCSSNELAVQIFNAVDSPTCTPYPSNISYTVSNECSLTEDYYTKIINASNCLGTNFAFNLVAHNTSDCADSGLPFTVIAQNGTCESNSFAPSYPGASWDTIIYTNKDLFAMEVYHTTDGTCQYPLGDFRTKKYGAECLAPVDGFYNTTFLNIYEAFPLTHT